MFTEGLSRLPLLWPAIGWMAGLGGLRSDLVPLPSLLWLVPALLLLACLKSLRPLALACLAGLTWAGLTLIHDAAVVAVDTSWLVKPFTVTADVIEVRHQPGRVRLTVDKVLRPDGSVLSGRAFLYGYGNRDRLSKWVSLLPGDRIRFKARWHLPENSVNPGAFDYRSYCFDRHIALIGTLSGEIRTVFTQPSWLETLRHRTRTMLASLNADQGGILRALLLADRSQVPIPVQEAFSVSGAAHLLAISGLHIGMVALWVFVIFWWLFTRREEWIVRIPVRKCCLGISLLIACGYAFLAGWPIPTRRAVLMMAGTVLAWWLRARTEPVNTLLAALMLILLLDPQAVMSVSLWLSFMAAFALLMWARIQPRGFHLQPLQWFLGLLSVSASASLATLPLISIHFELVPTYTLLANLFLVPLYTALILPFALMAEIAMIVSLDSAAGWLFQVAGYFVGLGNSLLLTLYQWPAGKLWIPSPPWWPALVYGTGMLTAGFLFFRGRVRLAAVLGLAGLASYLLLVIPERPPSEETFVVWDVGQGASSSLLFPGGEVMVVDAPGRPHARYNGGTKVAAGLRKLGQAHVDVLVLTHAQQDHVGGAGRLLDHVRDVREIWLADVPENHRHTGVQGLLRRGVRSGARIRWLSQGDQVRGRGYSIQVLWPPKGYDPEKDNDASLVFSLRLDKGGSILFPGDIEARAEKQIVGNGLGRHDLLLIPHHGSATSSGSDWVFAVKPVHAIAQVGRYNRYGFPRPAVVRRYRKAGSRIWLTSDGAVVAQYRHGRRSAWKIEHWRQKGSQNRLNALQWWIRHL
jgi:competence protein ComEC